MRRALIFLATLALASCGDSADSPDAAPTPRDAGRDSGSDAGPRCERATTLPSPLVCNGHAELCARRFDEVAYATTHNAMSNEEDRWNIPNQGRSLWHQLEDGVRGFMLDIYPPDASGEVLLCHGACGFLGQRPLVDALHDLREFMDCHPGEVLTIIFEPHVAETPMAAAFERAGLLDYLHTQPRGAAWPTLQEMITSGRRLVVFTETSDVSLPWYHHAYTYAWDNDYAATSASDFDCAPNRGSDTNSIFILNHFLTAPVAMRSLAETVNYDPVLSDHVDSCQRETGQLPNFVTLDFYDASDLFPVVERLNGF